MTTHSMTSLLLAGTAALALTGAAAAQNAAPSMPDQTAPASQANAPARGKPIQQIRSDLQQAGYSDIQLAPASILVNAKNKAGEPVMMLIGPNSITEVAAIDDGTANSNGTKSMQVAQNRAMTPREGRSAYVTVPSTDRLSSNLVGLDVYNDQNKDIGTIKDIAWGEDGIKAYIVSVGGFLGMGDRYIAVDPSAVKVSYESGSKKWQAKMDATPDQLKAAPEFKYSGPWAASKM